MSDRPEKPADPYAGPFDEAPWPKKLPARVVTPGPRPRVHGYDVEGDLARHHRFTEVVLLSLLGELPTEPAARAFDVVLAFLAPLAVTEAPTHAAVLARICAGKTSSIVATGAIGLAELARSTLEEHAPLLAFLDGGATGAPPSSALAADDADRAATARLRTAIAETDLVVPGLELDLGRLAAALATLHACGVRRAERLEVALTLARLATTTAEALAAKPAGFREYPLGLPPFRYVEDPRKQ